MTEKKEKKEEKKKLPKEQVVEPLSTEENSENQNPMPEGPPIK